MTRLLFPALCFVITLVLLASMPAYYALEGWAAEALPTLAPDDDRAVAVFLGLESPPADAAPTATDPDFDLAAEVAAYIEAHTPSCVLPLAGVVTSPFGARPDPFKNLTSAPTETHHGVDLASPTSTRIVAAKAGTVTAVATDPSYGLYLVLDHGDCSTLYAHCAAVAVTPGQTVAVGQDIATAGATGRATGVHLHFEVIVDGVRVDPLAYLGLTPTVAA